MTDSQVDLIDEVKQGFIYCLPFAETWRQFQMQQAFQGPANRLVAFRDLANASFRAVPSPNNDTLYTVAALDLRDGPIVLQWPAMPVERYFVVPIYNAFTDIVASYGTRTGEQGPLNLLITPPGFDGTVPDGFTMVELGSTIGSMLGRILVDGEDDLDAARAFQDAVVVETLADWSAGTRHPLIDFARPEPVPGIPADETRSSALGFWRAVGNVVVGVSIPKHDGEMFDRLAAFGLTRHGFTPPTDPAVLKAVEEGTREGWEFIAQFAANPEEASQNGVSFLSSGGWNWSAAARDPENTGRLIYGGRYLLRAWVNYLYYGALAPDEALYPTAYVDDRGETLSGDQVYTWRLNLADRPVRESGFLSVTLYDMEGYFVANPDRRYAIGDRDRDLVIDADGSITVTVSASQPETPTNWLPSPAGEPFYLMLRAYLPTEDLLTGSYPLEPVRRTTEVGDKA